MLKAFVIFVFAVLISLGVFFLFSGGTYQEEEQRVAGDYRDAEYIFSGEHIQLIDGVRETNTLMGAASKTVIRYFGNDVWTDLDKDGRDDVVFLVTQEAGGSGTFFYAVAALDTPRGFVGSHAVLIGDRIAPQTTNVDGRGFIVVNYADRAPGEPMTTQPSVGKSLYLKFDPVAMDFGEVVQNFEGESR